MALTASPRTLRFPVPTAQPAPAPPAAPSERPRRKHPAFRTWEGTALPGLGRLQASGWLPTLLLAACAVVLVYLVQISGVATTGYDIQRLQNERTEWSLRNEQLRLELAKLRSLAWVESEAVGRLGMQRPTAVTFVDVNAPGR